MYFLVFLVSKDLKIADLLWPFEDSAGGVSHDAIHNSVARFMGGAKVVSESARGRVATTRSGWISLGDYKGNTPNTAESTLTVPTLDTTQHRYPRYKKLCKKWTCFAVSQSATSRLQKIKWATFFPKLTASVILQSAFRE